jgi:hypothetical protein
MAGYSDSSTWKDTMTPELDETHDPSRVCASTDHELRTRRPRPRRGPSIPTILGSIGLLFIECFGMRNAQAELGPCTSAAPTTKDVIVFVSDMKRSVSWYRDNTGLAEVFSPRSLQRDSRAVVMERDGNGVTLVSSYKERPFGPDPQVVCFPQKGPRDPARRSSPVFLVDPDGTQVELPVSP